MRMGLVVFVKVYRESVGSTIIMKIMFLISVILILLFQLCNAQLGKSCLLYLLLLVLAL